MDGRCGKCGRELEAGASISVTGVGERCYGCFNEEIAARMGVEFDDTPIQPIELADADGVVHRFQITSLLVATGREMIAEEVPRPERGGFRFAVLGDYEADAWELFQRLYDKMKREMAVRHVEYTEFGWQLTKGERLVGRIEWDEETDGATPLLVVDGKAYSWDEVGRMLMTFEGFTLHARVEDSIEIVGGPLLEERDPGIRP
jgi:hypothetical protein